MPKSFMALRVAIVCSLSIVSSLISICIVFLSPDIAVLKEAQLVGRFLGLRLPVQPGGQDGIHRLEGAGVVLESAPGCGLDPFRLVLLTELYDTHTGPVSLLWISAGHHDLFHQLRRGYPDFGRPLDEACRAPLRILLVLRRHVLFECAMGAVDV